MTQFNIANVLVLIKILKLRERFLKKSKIYENIIRLFFSFVYLFIIIINVFNV